MWSLLCIFGLMFLALNPGDVGAGHWADGPRHKQLEELATRGLPSLIWSTGGASSEHLRSAMADARIHNTGLGGDV